MMVKTYLVFLSVSLLICLTTTTTCKITDPQMLVTFHPHLDAFWLNKDTQLKNINFVPAPFLYAMNQRNSKTILNSMLASLKQNKSRKYFITEVVFFKDWYQYLDPFSKQQVKTFFANRQFQIVNGGWVQNDEAVCYFDDIIDQYTVGLDYLRSKFDYEVKIGWATDSFGHSASQVALQHLLGFVYQAIQRVDDRYIHQRIPESLLEFYWAPVSDSNGLNYGGLATYVRHFLHQVNNLRNANLQDVAKDFSNVLKAMKSLYHKPKLFRFLGNDFQQFIPAQFDTLEKIFKVLNKKPDHSNCPIFKYGNPSDYLALFKQQYKQNELPIRHFDFMPNWDQDHYWNGYYTTDPDLKKKCKDFSRLLNFGRKYFIHRSGSRLQSVERLLQESNQLLALMQHHDGITATSKGYIQAEMKERMDRQSQALIKQFVQVVNGSNKQICKFYQNGNRCVISSTEQKIYLSVYHEGSFKRQILELQLPEGNFYKIIQTEKFQTFCQSTNRKCTILVEIGLYPGQNILSLLKIPHEYAPNIVNILDQGTVHEDQHFKVVLHQNQLDFIFNDNQFYNISVVRARAQTTTTWTSSWDKYARKTDKIQQRIPGIYIMANNGILESLQQYPYTQLWVGAGKFFTKIFAISKCTQLELTFKSDQPHLVDLQTTFMPPNYELNDYFLKVQSSIDPKDEFYHDMNGFLVMKRKIGQRPDYRWQYKQANKIAANTYPLCSFAYITNQTKKLVLFTDRAAGVSLYNKALIINIDRLTSDDYKGVGQGYMNRVRNVFRYKIGLVGREEWIQRRWQKEYDQGIIGLYSGDGYKKMDGARRQHEEQDGYLKYNVYNLNKDQYVLRIVNLQQKQQLQLSHYSQTSWALSQLDLNLHYQKIVQSFAHGAPLSPRHQWQSIPGEINTASHNIKDTVEHLVFRPLQIRSFRVSKNDRKDSSMQTIHLRKTSKEHTINEEDDKAHKGQKQRPSISKERGQSRPTTKPEEYHH